MALTCDDLRIGGTLSGSGISGGISINGSRFFVSDWTGLLGHVGYDRRLVQVAGRAGGYVVGDGTPDVRIHTLNLGVTRWDETGRGGLTEADEGNQLQANTDLIQQYLADPDGFYLERDMADGTTRFVHSYAIDPFPISQRTWRRMSAPLRSDTPFWRQGGTQSSDSLSGSDTLTNAGNARLYDAVLTFPSTGATLASSALGWSITTASTSASVVVDLGARTVIRGSTNVDALLTLGGDGTWPYFVPGDNSVTVTGSAIGVTWREPWDS